jgi:hypothetical protein
LCPPKALHFLGKLVPQSFDLNRYRPSSGKTNDINTRISFNPFGNIAANGDRQYAKSFRLKSEIDQLLETEQSLNGLARSQAPGSNEPPFN